MTGIITTVGTLLAAGVLAAGGSLGSTDDGHHTRTALVIDASQARDGRELVDPRLRDLDAEVRLPRTSSEAQTNVRYFDALGYRVIVSGPQATAAADEVGLAVEPAPDLAHAVRVVGG
jgi:hypothetical protein